MKKKVKQITERENKRGKEGSRGAQEVVTKARPLGEKRPAWQSLAPIGEYQLKRPSRHWKASSSDPLLLLASIKRPAIS
jgi:hypothetical protein